jgi:formylglycine-generating enzyme required for sulfatase activity/tRNA A-37 threonylcarbamoyl transferase component Bud32
MIDIGTRIENYEILGYLAEGAMGVLWKAENKAISKKVAIKSIHRHLVRQPEVVARFRREASVLAAITHRNVVDIYNFGDIDGELYYVMPFLQGESLDSRLEALPSHRMELSQAVGILAQVCDALAVVHPKNVVHRDLKPSNIFLVRETDGSEVVRLIDFGVAHLRDTESLTATDHLTGSPAYMAPEQWQDPRPLEERRDGSAITAATDIYGLGVVLFEVLTGCLPFDGASPWEIGIKCLRSVAPMVRDYNPDLPPAVEVVIQRCLRKAPAERYQSALELKRELQRLVAPGPASYPSGQGARAVLHPPPAGARGVVTGDDQPGEVVEPLAITFLNPADGTPAPHAELEASGNDLAGTERWRSLGLDLVPIPGGTHTQGYTEERLERLMRATGASREDVAHLLREKPHVQLPIRPYRIARDPVTRAQFRQFIRASGYKGQIGTTWDLSGGDRLPVTNISWYDAQAFCDYFGLRLPTATEWEYAASGGDGRLYPWGDRYSATCCNDSESGRGLLEVGSSPGEVGPWGLRDMGGNVWELLDAGMMIKGQPFKIAVGGSYLGNGRQDAMLDACHLLAADSRDIDVGFRVGLREAETACDPEFVRVPGGRLAIGCGPAAAAYAERVFGRDQAQRLQGEFPPRETVVQAFELMRDPVSNYQYYRFVRATRRASPEHWGKGSCTRHPWDEEDSPYPRWMRDLPVTQVRLDDALAYARWVGGTLPTGDEWECAACDGSARVYPWGDAFQIWHANTAEIRLGRPSAPGEFPHGSTSAGVRDLCGNVAEFVLSVEERDAAELRGGSWTHGCGLWGMNFVHTLSDPDARLDWRGFRVGRR